MKISLLTMTVFLFLSCSPFSTDDTTIEIFADADKISSSNKRLDITDPEYDHFAADRVFQISGSVSSGTEAERYFWLKVTKGTETTSYWLTGDFDINIWLRFGEGKHLIEIFPILGIDINANGVITGWRYYITSVWTVIVENTNPIDGRLLFPSAVIQADNVDIIEQADTFASSDNLTLIREIHDWVVKYLYYDFDSTILTDRKKQDAVSVLKNKMAVCEGYTTLYNALLRARGIQAQYVSGTVGEGSHAWSYVSSDDISFRYIDTTWDDPVMGNPGTSDYPDGYNLRHDYFWEENFPDHTPENWEIDRSIATIYPSADFPGYPEGSY